MRISRISVKKLFGTRNFELNLKNGHGFFFGENGAGKTTFLNIIYAMLSGQENLIPQGLKFEEFEIEFENGESIKKTQVFEWPSLVLVQENQTLIHYRDNFERYLNQYISYLESIKVNYPSINGINVENIINELNSKNVDALLPHTNLNRDISTLNVSISNDLGNPSISSWFQNMTNHYNQISNVIKQNNIQRTRTLLDNINNEILFLNVYRNRPKVNLNQVRSNNEQNLYEEGDIVLTSIKLNELKQKVQNSAKEMKSLINQYYIDMSNSLLDKLLSIDMDEELVHFSEDEKNIIDRVFDYIHGLESTKKERLKRILLGEEGFGKINKVLTESFKPFIEEYQKQALPIENNINMFLDIVNKYLVHKKIKFDKQDFNFILEIDSHSEVLDEKLLSSGEKHIFSVFSNLVFNKKGKIHLLIDEPELSLSINWQKMFIKDITSFEKVKNLIFVTHSPYVIPEEMINDLQRFPSGNENE